MDSREFDEAVKLPNTRFLNIASGILLLLILLCLGSCSIPRGLIEHTEPVEEEVYYKKYGNTYLRAIPMQIGEGEYIWVPLPPEVEQ